MDSQIQNNLNDAQPIIRELRDLGFDIDTPTQLRQRYSVYDLAIPILLKWLPRVANVRIKEDIVRNLSIKRADSGVANKILDELPQPGLHFDWASLPWAIGNAMAVLADDAMLDRIIEVVQRKELGRAREMFADALGNMVSPRAVEVLMDSLDDEQIAGHAIIALGKLKAQVARSRIERFLSHEKTWVRAEARKALAKIDRAMQGNETRK